MTVLIHSQRFAESPAGAAGIDVFGVQWPIYKVHAVIAGLVLVPVVLLLTGSAVAAAWIAAVAVVALWWGERRVVTRRCNDVRRDPALSPSRD